MGKYSKKPTEKEAPLWPLLLAAVLLIVGGAGIFLYPTVTNFLAERKQAAVIQGYNAKTERTALNKLAAEWEKARAFNRTQSGIPTELPFGSGTTTYSEAYMQVLNLAGDGMMGYISIPKISVRIPIYHGCDENALQKGIGHLSQTHLPIGGEGTHTVLSGHRGLPLAEIFTRLDELEIGDVFYINVLNETLAYEVDAINVVTPEDITLLNAVEGEDLATLVTCTPYGINTHRLLVRGQRTEMPEEEKMAENPRVHLVVHGMTDQIIKWVVLIVVGTAVFAGGILFSGGKKRKKDDADEKE